jgi:transposase
MKATHHHPNRALSMEELERRRKKAGRCFDQGKTAYFVEKKFNVSSTTAREWRTRWKNGILAAQRQGHPPKLSDKEKKNISRIIKAGPEAAGYRTQLWTLARVTALIAKECKVTYRARSVWHLLHALGFSCQKPARKAKERDEKRIRQWKNEEWPKLLKKGLV